MAEERAVDFWSQPPQLSRHLSDVCDKFFLHQVSISTFDD